MTDTIFDLAAALGFKDLGHTPQGVRPGVSADSEGRTGGGCEAPGAVPFTLPPAKAWRSFDGPQAGGPPPRPKPTGPVPHPPPPFVPGEFPPPVIGEGQLYDVDHALWRALSVECPAWPSSRRPL